jgi:prophage regulatory protein
MSTPARHTECLLTARELSDMLHVSVRTVWRLRSSAAIPAPVRIRGSVRWNRNEVQRWIDQGCPMIGMPRRKG